MNRNVESHFALNPTRLDIRRSRFDRSYSHKLSFNVGDLIPFHIEEVLPGDTFSVDSSKVVRMQSLITPIMDNVYLDTYYFFVPNRLCWEHWRQFCGENTESAWIPATDYQIPQLSAPEDGWNIGGIADYFGIPTGVPGLTVSALPFRAYALICDQWFRDENLMDPLNIPVDDATVQGVNTGVAVTDVAKGGKPFVASKYHDYFTSCLPSPQKGPDVLIPVVEGQNFPVVPLAEEQAELPEYAMFLRKAGQPAPGTGYSIQNSGALSTAGTTEPVALDKFEALLAPTNLWAVTTGFSSAASINQLRLAFQIQKFYERDARGGTRYIELLKSHFGVTSPDSRLQRPEYLGGNRIPITINQVVQQSATMEGSTPQGTPVGLSQTTDRHSDFTKSFTEHGFIIGVMCARYTHTYQQGIERFWSRKSKFDYYWPVFANIGEQAVLNKEIYAQGTPEDDEVFGYQEAWADYRYKPNRVSGEMRSAAPQSLDVWHLADDYEQLPKLSEDWVREDGKTVDRVLAVQSSNANQLFADIYIKQQVTRAMPLYSVPGLIDHH